MFTLFVCNFQTKTYLRPLVSETDPILSLRIILQVHVFLTLTFHRPKYQYCSYHSYRSLKYRLISSSLNDILYYNHSEKLYMQVALCLVQAFRSLGQLGFHHSVGINLTVLMFILHCVQKIRNCKYFYQTKGQHIQ